MMMWGHLVHSDSSFTVLLNAHMTDNNQQILHLTNLRWSGQLCCMCMQYLFSIKTLQKL